MRGKHHNVGVSLGPDVRLAPRARACAHTLVHLPSLLRAHAARPEGTSAWTEEQLARLVSRDSMIGLCPASDPQSLPVPHV